MNFHKLKPSWIFSFKRLIKSPSARLRKVILTAGYCHVVNTVTVLSSGIFHDYYEDSELQPFSDFGGGIGIGYKGNRVWQIPFLSQ